MNTSSNIQSKNPFERLTSPDYAVLWGRRNELRQVCNCLRDPKPHCCAIIGETYIGKTTLLRYLADSKDSSMRKSLGIEHITFIYVDTGSYIEMAVGDAASVQFWWDAYNASRAKLDTKKSSKLPPPDASTDSNPIDTAIRIKLELERLIKAHGRPVVFAFDNFEGIANLPLRDSAWLRAIALHYDCAYVVSSRHLLQLLYHPASWSETSPLWNLFLDYIYLGLMGEQEITSYILQDGKLDSFWKQDDIIFIRKMAGRHPELVRIACSHVFEYRRQHPQSLNIEDFKYLESWIYKDATPICNVLWHGLADPELMGISRVSGYPKETWKFSLPQEVLMSVVKEHRSSDSKLLFELQQRGLIEQVNGEFHVFAEVMSQFVLRQEQIRNMVEAPPSKTTDVSSTALRSQAEQSLEGEPTHAAMYPAYPAFTYLEDKVYSFLLAHAGEVCDKETIKQAIWEHKSPTDSTLQKIIERIRKKIEPDPDNPRHLLAVRGQGYILREGHTDLITTR